MSGLKTDKALTTEEQVNLQMEIDVADKEDVDNVQVKCGKDSP